MHTWLNRLRIEKFVYEKGTNVALYNAEHAKQYQVIKEQIETGIYDQISYIANTKEKLLTLLMLAKAAGQDLVSQVGVMLAERSLSKDVQLSAYLVWAASEGGQAALDKLGISGVFGLKNQELIDYFNDYSRLIIDSVDSYTKEWIANKIQEGKDKGLTPFEIARMLKDDGRGITTIRAERIVLTETQKAMTTLERAAAKRYGIKTLIWRTSRDDRVDPICLELEGKESSISGVFPGGYDGPPAHVSCRCYLEEVVPDEWVIPDKIWLGE